MWLLLLPLLWVTTAQWANPFSQYCSRLGHRYTSSVLYSLLWLHNMNKYIFIRGIFIECWPSVCAFGKEKKKDWSLNQYAEKQTQLSESAQSPMQVAFWAYLQKHNFNSNLNHNINHALFISVWGEKTNYWSYNVIASTNLQVVVLSSICLKWCLIFPSSPANKTADLKNCLNTMKGNNKKRFDVQQIGEDKLPAFSYQAAQSWHLFPSILFRYCWVAA